MLRTGKSSLPVYTQCGLWSNTPDPRNQRLLFQMCQYELYIAYLPNTVAINSFDYTTAYLCPCLEENFRASKKLSVPPRIVKFFISRFLQKMKLTYKNHENPNGILTFMKLKLSRFLKLHTKNHVKVS